ncbi:MAG: c-type cytochrome, partial [Pseudomonadota bacterium]
SRFDLRYWPMPVVVGLVWTIGCAAPLWAGEPPVATESNAIAAADGRAVYRYYCYQCHGYAGDAKTLAATYFEHKPRDFTQATKTTLTREAMRNAVVHGRPGTAMVSFNRVLTPAQIDAVVSYIRTSFMVSRPVVARYHSPENGWNNHARYAAAFPFATGAIPLNRPWELLTPEQRDGKRLFLSSCITCHDRARSTDEGPVWEAFAVSYPRPLGFRPPNPGAQAAPAKVDDVSSASPFRQHENAPSAEGLTAVETRGRGIFLENCAFCHAPDASGRNWIGSFLIPRPRDLTDAAIRQRDWQSLVHVIADGLPGTSMPAWRHVLTDNQISDVVAYLQRRRSAPAEVQTSDRATRPAEAGIPLWKRANPAR